MAVIGSNPRHTVKAGSVWETRKGANLTLRHSGVNGYYNPKQKLERRRKVDAFKGELLKACAYANEPKALVEHAQDFMAQAYGNQTALTPHKRHVASWAGEQRNISNPIKR